MIGPWTAMAAALAILAGLTGLLKLIERLLRPHPEILRKLLHMGMGLLVLCLPWVFHDRWPVLLLAGVSAALIATVKLVPRWHDGIGSVMTAVARPTLGEVCFPVAVATLFVMSRGNTLLFVVPMLITALADAAAALIGLAYGRVRYVTSEGLKSAEGSLAFFMIAFFSVHVPLLLFTGIGRPETLLIAVIIGLLSMLLEAVAARGLDNLLIPLGAYAFLRLYMHYPADLLAWRLVATLTLLVFALMWRRRTSLDDSGLMACALFGYGAMMIGGWRWLIGPGVLFLVHVALWPRTGPRREHNVWAVLGIISAGLLWLAIQINAAPDRWLLPYAVAFGCHMAIIGMSRLPLVAPGARRESHLAAAIMGGWALVLTQVAVMALGLSGFTVHVFVAISVISAVCVVMAAMAFRALMPWMYGPRGSDAAIYICGAALGMLGSMLAATFYSLALRQ